MKLTKHKLYNLIQEELLSEAAKGMQDIPEGARVVCAQASSMDHLKWNWKKSPLSKIYSKKPTTIQALKKQEKWTEQ